MTTGPMLLTYDESHLATVEFKRKCPSRLLIHNLYAYTVGMFELHYRMLNPSSANGRS
jgi:hypothetical protein